jgi:glycerophosphoryl diester phosphodiesterase
MTNKILLLFLLSTMLSCSSSRKTYSNKTAEATNPVFDFILQKAEKEILICAHRSFHKTAPENSLQSVKDAIALGIDFIEIDVRTTIDDSLVIMHDNTIDRTTNGKGEVNMFTYAQLQQFNLKIEDSVTVHKIPVLNEVFSLLKGTSVIVNLDQKAVKTDRLHAYVRSAGMEHQVISYTGGWANTKKNIREDPLFAVLPMAKTKADIDLYNDRVLSPLIHLVDETFTTENMKTLKENGKISFVNTLWDEDDTFILGETAGMDSVISLRPSIIQTDYPELLKNYLKQKGLHN